MLRGGGKGDKRSLKGTGRGRGQGAPGHESAISAACGAEQRGAKAAVDRKGNEVAVAGKNCRYRDNEDRRDGKLRLRSRREMKISSKLRGVGRQEA